MTSAQINMILDAFDSVGIEGYRVTNDVGDHLYNGFDSGIVINDKGNQILYGISRKSRATGADPWEGNVTVKCSDYEIISQIDFGGTYQQILDALQAMGVSVTDEQRKFIVETSNKNYNVIPETGNYHPFHELTQEEVDALPEDEKAEYEKRLKEWKDMKSGRSSGFTVRVQC